MIQHVISEDEYVRFKLIENRFDEYVEKEIKKIKKGWFISLFFIGLLSGLLFSVGVFILFGSI